jgi:hypothetical protein
MTSSVAGALMVSEARGILFYIAHGDTGGRRGGGLVIF